MACNWTYDNKGNINGAKTESGAPSALFKELEQRFGTEDAVEMYAVSQSDKFKKLYNNEQLSQTKKQGLQTAGTIATKAEAVLERGGGTISENTPREEQIDQLRVWSYDNGYFIEDYQKLGKFQERGMESEVFYNKKNNSVIKVNDLEFYETPLEYLEAISVHNELFPEAKIQLKGFTTRQDTFNFAFIIEQPFIIAERGATQKEVQEELSKMGYSYIEDNTYTNGTYTIEDLHEGNVLIDADGRLYFIDPVIRTNGGEVSADIVVKYLTAQNANKEPITKEQKLDVMNFLLATEFENAQQLLDSLQNVFYTDGLFFISEDKLVNSGLYSRFEAENLSRDLDLQEQVKTTVEQLKNTEGLEDIASDNFTDLKKLDEFTSLGKFRLENPYLKPIEGQKTARRFAEVDGQIRETLTEDLELIMPLVVKDEINTELLANIQVVLETPNEVIEENEELLNKVYSKIEDLAIAQGIDVLDVTFDKVNLTALYNFVAVPSKENMTALVSLLNKNTTPKEVVIKDKSALNLTELNTTISDKEVFESTGLLRMRDNLYVQTRKQPLEEMYNNLFLHKDKIPQSVKTLEEFETFIQAKLTPQTTEEMELFKMFYGEQQNQKQEEVKVGEASEYLLTDFVSDFYIKSLQEKKKDSAIYNNFYKHFEVNENGINLINQDPITIAQIKEYADENLLNYSLVSRQMPALKESNETLEDRFIAANYPQTVKDITEKAFTVGNSYIVKGIAPKFTKINGEVYESVSRVGQLSLYEKLPSPKKDYTQKIDKPTPSVNLEDYISLESTPEKFKTMKNYLTKQEKEVAEQDFIC